MLVHQSQRLVCQAAQAALLHAFRRRVDGRQRVVDRGVLVFTQHTVLRVDHFQPCRTLARLAETGQSYARLKLRLLLS